MGKRRPPKKFLATFTLRDGSIDVLYENAKGGDATSESEALALLMRENADSVFAFCGLVVRESQIVSVSIVEDESEGQV